MLYQLSYTSRLDLIAHTFYFLQMYQNAHIASNDVRTLALHNLIDVDNGKNISRMTPHTRPKMIVKCHTVYKKHDLFPPKAAKKTTSNYSKYQENSNKMFSKQLV
jgi:hypothetical protein